MDLCRLSWDKTLILHTPLLSGLSLASRAHVHWHREAAILLFTNRYLLLRRRLPAKLPPVVGCGSFIKHAQYIWTAGLCWMTWNLATVRLFFVALHCKKWSDLYCWSCQCQRVCSLWLSWKRLRNVWLGRMFLWPESEMRVGVSFYVTGSGVPLVRPQRNCWNQSSLDCLSHPEGYMCNSNLTHNINIWCQECKSQRIYGKNRVFVTFLDFKECV